MKARTWIKSRYAPRTAPAADELLTPEEAAERLRIGMRTLVRLQYEGVLPYVVLGKCVRFHWPTIVAHLTSRFTLCHDRTRVARERNANPGGGRNNLTAPLR